MGAAQPHEQSFNAPAPLPPNIEWDDEPNEDDPYELYVLRRPHERSSTVLQNLQKHPEFANTRLKYHRTPADEAALSAIPRRFEFPTRPSMLESLTDTDEESELGSRWGRSTFSRRSFSLPSSAGTIVSVKPEPAPRRRPMLPPGLPKAPKLPLAETTVKRRDTMPAKPSMLGYPPNAKPPLNYKGSALREKENRRRPIANVDDVGGRKVAAPAAYGANAAKNFALVVESPSRTPRAPRVPRAPLPAPRMHAPPSQWPPLPSEWPPAAPALAGVPSNGNVPLRVEAIAERTNNKSNYRKRNQRQRSNEEPKARNRSKRRCIIRSSARLRTYLRTASGRERAATGAATRRASGTGNLPGGLGVERERELSIVSASASVKDEKGSGRAALRRVLGLLRITTMQRAR